MEKRPRLFIYENREMMILSLLGLVVGLFAFTLGIHLGKNVTYKQDESKEAEIATPVETTRDAPPGRRELFDQSKGIDQAAEQAMGKALQDEVARTGIRMDPPRQTTLPDTTKAASGGSTTVSSEGVVAEESKIPALLRPTPRGRFTIQVGSYPSIDQAQNIIQMLESQGLEPFVRGASVEGMGRWYRVFLGGFTTKKEAESAGEQYKNRNMIDSYIIAQMPASS